MPIPTVSVLLALLAGASPSEPTWPRFRGPDGTGVLSERLHPASWGPEEHLAWSAPIPGGGWSSPVVIGERVLLTTAVSADGARPEGFQGGVQSPMSRGGGGAAPETEVAYVLMCLSLEDGAELWARELGRGVPAYAVHPSNTYATCSPATDGERVFATFGALGEVVACDLEGEELWRVATGVHRTGNDFGWGTSLALHEGLVFVQNDNAERSFLAAFDAESGEQRWRVDRPLGSSWGTPVLWPQEGGAQLVACGPDTVIGYAPRSGAELWRVQGFGGSFSSSPTFDAERLVLGNSGPMSRGPLMAVPAGLEGALDLKADGRAGLAWLAERAGPGFPSPVLHQGRVYVLGSPSVLACHDARTGERLWRERLPDAATVVASPWVAGDELFVLDEKGDTYVVSAGGAFELLGVNQLEGLYWATPSVAGASLLLREAQRLHCVREAGG